MERYFRKINKPTSVMHLYETALRKMPWKLKRKNLKCPHAIFESVNNTVKTRYNPANP